MRREKIFLLVGIMLFIILIAVITNKYHEAKNQKDPEINSTVVNSDVIVKEEMLNYCGNSLAIEVGALTGKFPIQTIYYRPTRLEVSNEILDNYHLNEEDKNQYIITNRLNVRNKPSFGADVVTIKNLNDKIHVIGNCRTDGDWTAIEMDDGTTAFVASAYVGDNKIVVEKPATSTTQKTSKTFKTGTRYNNNWDGGVLTAQKGRNNGPSGSETFYNLDMTYIVNRMHKQFGITDEYWVRDDGVKMLGNYVMVGANFAIHPRGSIVETSLGTGIVCDTGYYDERNWYNIDIATAW